MLKLYKPMLARKGEVEFVVPSMEKDRSPFPYFFRLEMPLMDALLNSGWRYRCHTTDNVRLKKPLLEVLRRSAPSKAVVCMLKGHYLNYRFFVLSDEPTFDLEKGDGTPQALPSLDKKNVTVTIFYPKTITKMRRGESCTLRVLHYFESKLEPVD